MKYLAFAAGLALALWIGFELWPAEVPQSAAPELASIEPALAPETEPLLVEACAVQRERAEQPTAKENGAPDDLRIHVIDGSTGERTNDFEVSLAWRIALPGGAFRLRQIHSGMPEGDARELRVPRAVVAASAKELLTEPTLEVSAVGIFERPVRLQRALDPWPNAPLELVLPPTGWIRLRTLDREGRPASLDGAARILHRRARSDTSLATLALEGGVTPLIACQVDLRCEVSTILSDVKYAPRNVRGPRTPRQTKWIDLVPGGPPPESECIVRLRVLLADGEPLRCCRISVSTEALRGTDKVMGRSGQSSACQTDAEGWIEFPFVDAGFGPILTQGLEVSYVHAERGHLSGFLEIAQEIPAGTTLLGDLLLRETELLASGLVVDAANRPIAGARVSAWILEGDAPTSLMGAMAQESDEGGRFALCASRAAVHVRLEAAKKGYVSSIPLDIPTGSSAVRLQLDAAASLSGSVRVPEGMSPTAIGVHVDPLGKKRAAKSVGVNADGTFFIGEIPAGSHGVHFVHAAIGKLETIIDVQFAAGEENRDPRLQGLVLCAGWRWFALRLLDPEGNGVQHATVALHIPSKDLTRTLRTDSEGRGNVWIPPAEDAFALHAPGYRAVHLVWSPGEQEVHLRCGIRVQIPVEASLFPPIARTCVRLRSAEGSGSDRVDVVDGLAELVVPEPGHYELEASIVTHEGDATRIRPVALDPPYAVEIRESGGDRLPACAISEGILRAGLLRR